MNNFFLRPWARGPVFSGEEEGNKGGGGDEKQELISTLRGPEATAAANREASLGGAAASTANIYDRGPRTRARISTGRQNNMDNRFAGINNTIYDNDNNNDIPSYGSVPPGTGSGIDYSGIIPPAGEGGSSRILDGVISGNDDPDFFLAPTFQEGDLSGSRNFEPGVSEYSSDSLFKEGDVSGTRNTELDLRPDVLTSLGNMLVGPAGGATAGSNDNDGRRQGILSGFQDFAGDLYTGTKDLGKDIVT